jgi:16S rRNA (uracil1498-N3)-methyltransferase
MHNPDVCPRTGRYVNRPVAAPAINGMIRLYVDSPLFSEATVEASAAQGHYLGAVMRRGTDDRIHLFNGRDGEWISRITVLGRGKATLYVETQSRPQRDEPDIWLVFGLLKRDATDLVVEKATELGVSTVLPAVTERTNAARVNLDRLRAIAVEAAEQCERLTVPTVHPPNQLQAILRDWPTARPLLTAMERADVAPLTARLPPVGLLIGPEGGFGPRDHMLLRQHEFVRSISLGPRILRAETAAIAGLALLQAPV